LVITHRPASVIVRERADGHRIYYGDVRGPEVLRSVGVADADPVIVTLDDFAAAEDVVAAMQQINQDVIWSGGTMRSSAGRCASLVVSENLEASLELAREAMILDDGDTDQAESLILRFRDAHYDSIGGNKPEDTSGQAKM
jgi:voltage-gated potassium channel Kch